MPAAPNLRRAISLRTTASNCARPWQPWASPVFPGEGEHININSLSKGLGLGFGSVEGGAEHVQLLTHATYDPYSSMAILSDEGKTTIDTHTHTHTHKHTNKQSY